MLYLEDLHEGRTFELGSVEVTKADMLAFAEEFDPQAFHVDENVAKEMFGGLIASGWHTASLAQRLMVDGFLGLAACMASPGVDDLRFVKPVFAGDVLSAKITIARTKRSQKKPDRGLAELRIEVFKAEDTLVLSMLGKVIVGCRPQAR